MDFLGNLHPHGVFLRREALAEGVDEQALYAAMAAGEIIRVRHGAYVAKPRWTEADEVGRHVLRAHAAALRHGDPMAVSHVSGALLHGMRSWNVPLDRVDIARPADTGGRRYRDVDYHRRELGNLVVVDGTNVLESAVCALEAASRIGVEEGLVLIDSAYDLGLCTPEEIRAAYESRIGWPGTARLRVTLPLTQVGAQSVGESRMRYLFWRVGVPRPLLQFPIMIDGQPASYVDFAWPDHGVLGEFDGKVKYEEHLREGERASDAVFREKQREDWIREVTGWKMLRFTWADLYRPEQVRFRVLRALGGRN